MKMCWRWFWAGMAMGLGGCAAPAPAPPPGPILIAPSAQDLLHDKVQAFQAGVAAGERAQARRDAQALAAAHAALLAETASPVCPAPTAAAPSPATAPPPAPKPTPEAPVPGTTPAPVYSPRGPAVPLATQ